MSEPRPCDSFFSSRKTFWPMSLGLLGVTAVAVLWRVLLASHGVDLFTDDAYYYMVIARSFAETGRLTFDGSSLTHGFHPLLFWLEAAGYVLFGTHAPALTQYAILLASLGLVFLATVGGCLWLVHRPARTGDDAMVQGALFVTLCVLLVPRFSVPFLSGMESILVLPLLILAGWLAWRSHYAWAGIAALLLVMARLDTLLYVILPLGAACAWRERHRGWAAVGVGLRMVLPAGLGTALLMGWHLCYFGNPMPIHGALKSCFPKVHVQWQHVFGGPFDSGTLRFALVAAVGGAVLLGRGRNLSRQARGMGLTAAALGLVQLAAFALFQKWSKPIPVWYVGPALLTGVFALAMGAASVLGRRWLQSLAIVAAVAVAAVNLVSIGRAWSAAAPPWAVSKTLASGPARGPDSIVDFMRSQPQDCVFACTDCGKIAFWSDRRVVNLDGLVNDFQYQDDLRDGRLVEHLRRKNVRYLVCTAWDRSQTDGDQYEPMYRCRVAPDVYSGRYDAAEFYVYSYKYLRYSDTIRLPRRAEVWRSAPGRDGRAMARTIVFDLDLALGGDRTLAQRASAGPTTGVNPPPTVAALASAGARGASGPEPSRVE